MGVVKLISYLESLFRIANPQLASVPEMQLALLTTKVFVDLLEESFSEDLQKTINQDLAKTEMDLASNSIKSLNYEAPENMKLGINRTITHFESAFAIFCKMNEFSSSCICALYLSCLHTIIGNTHPEIHKRIMERIPLSSDADSINYGEYSSLVSKFLLENDYYNLCANRKEKYLSKLDTEIEDLKRQVSLSVGFGAQTPFKVLGLRLRIEILESTRRKVLDLVDGRSDLKKVWDISKPWFLS